MIVRTCAHACVYMLYNYSAAACVYGWMCMHLIRAGIFVCTIYSYLCMRDPCRVGPHVIIIIYG